MMLTLDQAKHYLFEVIRETDLVARLYSRFEQAADDWLRTDHVLDPDGAVLWSNIESERTMEESIEGILSGFARVSLFFFPSGSAGPQGAERGRELRRLTNIGDDHPLSKRDLRNHWMHLDERLDAVLAASGVVPVGYLLQQHTRLTTAQTLEVARLVDPAEARVYVFGEAFDIRSLADGVAHAGQQAAVAIMDAKGP